MSLTYDLVELLAYSDAERRKWRGWFAADPSRMSLPFQPGGRFPTIGHLLDHVFLVERRHLARLEGGTPPESTGLRPTDVEGLFEYGDMVRDDFRSWLADVDDEAGRVSMTFTVPMGTFTLTRRKLAVHIVLHEVRHLAQIAYAARAAGHEPPGEHDIFFFQEFP